MHAMAKAEYSNAASGDMVVATPGTAAFSKAQVGAGYTFRPNWRNDIHLSYDFYYIIIGTHAGLLL
jgi:hypothetical protein